MYMYAMGHAGITEHATLSKGSVMGPAGYHYFISLDTNLLTH